MCVISFEICCCQNLWHSPNLLNASQPHFVCLICIWCQMDIAHFSMAPVSSFLSTQNILEHYVITLWMYLKRWSNKMPSNVHTNCIIVRKNGKLELKVIWNDQTMSFQLYIDHFAKDCFKQLKRNRNSFWRILFRCWRLDALSQNWAFDTRNYLVTWVFYWCMFKLSTGVRFQIDSNHPGQC